MDILDKVMKVEQDVMLRILGFNKIQVPGSNKYIYTHMQIYGLKIDNNIMYFNSEFKSISYRIKDISNNAEVLAAMIQCIKEMYYKEGANKVKNDIIDILGIEDLIHDIVSKRLDI